ncbi:BatD family protein [Roseibium sp. MMSF_3544]|uniref:BatD family protein n=1 Tax=unclassified Roseibium TaxID=2629323 RepID=UPI00273DAFE5|nr:BatD family protein [Roseibium sp. MMSF_3544]
MKRFLVFLCVFPVLSLSAWGQDAVAPEIRTSLEKNSAIPGQPVIYRVSILVPTWLPAPPEFPSFEAPNVMVRLPSRASGPTSETVNGETWSGVSRTYRFYPMAAGTFQIPAGTIKVTYADPETREPVSVVAASGGFEIIGQVPPGAETLDPFLGANSVTLERSVDGTPDQMREGDALTITTVVTVSGVSPMFVPPVQEENTIVGLASYPKEPVLQEKEDRGILSGSRTTETALVAETAGNYTIPEISLSWYNLDSGKIETVTAPAIPIAVSGAASAPVDAPATTEWRSLIGLIAFLGVLSLCLFFIWRRFSPRVLGAANRARNNYLASEPYLFRRLVSSIKRKDIQSVMHLSTSWKRAAGNLMTGAEWNNYEKALYLCSALSFDGERTYTQDDLQKRWSSLLTEARTIRKIALKIRKARKTQDLGDLNPI